MIERLKVYAARSGRMLKNFMEQILIDYEYTDEEKEKKKSTGGTKQKTPKTYNVPKIESEKKLVKREGKWILE